MIIRGAAIERPALVRRADRFELLRCRCPECLVLDSLFPGQGFQLAFWPYRPPDRRLG